MRRIIEQSGFDPASDADNGNRFLVGNGYMGVRGTLCEAGAEQMAAVNLAGIHHQKGGGWREPLNAPNPLYFRIRGAALPENAAQITAHHLELDIGSGLFARKTIFSLPDGRLTLRQERFCAMDDPHLLAQRITLTADAPTHLVIESGTDDRVWDIHGPHYEQQCLTEFPDITLITAKTDDGQRVCVARRCTFIGGKLLHGGVYEQQCVMQPGVALNITMEAAIFTSSDGNDPAQLAMDALRAAPNYEALLIRQKSWWEDMWDKAAVLIEGDERAEFAVNYSLYHLISIAPRHHQSLSVPARGLSGQTYKGAIFWDTEIFMMDFYISCMPEVARTCLRYRIDTLPGALAKAAAYGHRGAFYAWESQSGGHDACTDYNVTDVFTGRPMRTYFRDKQVHISAAIVYALRNYVLRTGDHSILDEGGAQMTLECARFYYSLLSKQLTSDEYDLKDVIGPDEYHERVDNNAYTNEMARMVLRYAAEICPCHLPDSDPAEIAAFIDAANHLKEQRPAPVTGVIPQFDGYLSLEDTNVASVRSRLLDPREYWGGAYGVASQTQVIKQADVIAMLSMLDQYPNNVMAANYDYYEPRTEHGSSLSACMYALCACQIGRSDAAYPLFLKSAEADIVGGGKQWAGLVYIGGTHPAAAGGTYKVLLYGFLGARFTDDGILLEPKLPEGWHKVRLKLFCGGQWKLIEVSQDKQ